MQDADPPGRRRRKVRAAVNYAAAYPEEIEPLIERACQMSEQKLRQLNAA